MTHLRIEQSEQAVETVSESLIKKLYDTAQEIPEPEEGEEDNAYMSGHISVPHTYSSYVEYLAGSIGEGTSGVVTSLRQNVGGRFPNLRIDVTNGNYIPFEDPNMVAYLNSIGVGSNGNITTTEASAATVVANSRNTTVTKFNELKYFTNITESKSGWTGTNSGDASFCFWTALLEIDISNYTSLGHVNDYAWEDTFNGCTSLKKVTASNKLTKIGSRAFSECSNLEQITGLSGNIELSRYAFMYCSKLTSDNFENCSGFLFNESGAFAFEGCTSLTTLPPLSGNLADRTCYGCSNLETIDLTGITAIGNSAFLDCTKLNCTISCPYLTGSLGSWGFYNTKITKVLDLGSCTSIGRECFSECKNLLSIEFPSSLQELGLNTFRNATSLSGIIDLSNTRLTWARSGLFLNTKITGIIFPTTLTEYGETWSSPVLAGVTTCTIFKGLDNVTSIYNSDVINCTNAVYLGKYISGLWSPITGGETRSASVNLIYFPVFTNFTRNNFEDYYGTPGLTFFTYRCLTYRSFSANLVYFKDLLTIIGLFFYRTIIKNLVINNTTPPVFDTTTATYPSNISSNYINLVFGQLNSTGTNGMIIYVPDSAVSTYLADSNYNSYVIRGINEINPSTNLPYLTRYATNELWEAAGSPADALIEEYML